MTTKANISWVTDQVATGGDLSFNQGKAADQILDLLSQQIDLIIDCRVEADDTVGWYEMNQPYLHLPVDDDYGSHLPSWHFDKAVEAARPILDRGGKVFVHCHMGVNRGPSTAYALLLDQGMPAVRAFDKIIEARPEATVYYAEDALDAHLKRRRVRPQAYATRKAVLKAHIRKVFTQERWDNVQHVIRTGHAQDREDLNAL